MPIQMHCPHGIVSMQALVSHACTQSRLQRRPWISKSHGTGVRAPWLESAFSSCPLDASLLRASSMSCAFAEDVRICASTSRLPLPCCEARLLVAEMVEAACCCCCCCCAEPGNPGRAGSCGGCSSRRPALLKPDCAMPRERFQCLILQACSKRTAQAA